MSAPDFTLALPRTVRDLRGMRRAAAALRPLVRDLQPDIVHCHGARSFLVTRWADAKAFVTLHGINPVASDPVGYRLVREIGLMVLSRLARQAFAVMPEPPRGWTFLPHASARLSEWHRAKALTNSEPTFLWVGRLEHPKRPEQFVSAIAELARRRPGVRGLVAGSGIMARELAEQIERLGAPVELLGHVTDIFPLLEEAWVLVLLCDSEAMGFVVEEAMWAGRPVVSTSLPGTRWLLGEDGGCGALVESGRSPVPAMMRLCDPDAVRVAGTLAAERVRTLLQPDDPWPCLERIYRAALSDSGV